METVLASAPVTGQPLTVPRSGRPRRRRSCSLMRDLEQSPRPFRKGYADAPQPKRLCGDDKGVTERVYTELPRPTVVRHPVTGRQILFVNPMHTHGFKGMRREEAWQLIEELEAHSTQERFVYYHRWRVGDVLM
jgi:Taurine catabolism dioxygenase TauD, TfdA family